MKNLIFAFTALLVFTLVTTDAHAQSKVKKSKLKTKQGTLNQPIAKEWIRDSMYYLKKVQDQPLQTSNNVNASNKPRGGMTKGPAVPGSIWDTLPPQVRGGKRTPKLQKNQTSQNQQGIRRNNPNRVKGQALQQNPKQLKMRPNKTQSGARKKGQKRKKTTQKNEF